MALDRDRGAPATIAVIGAGAMGAGIGGLLVRAGHAVVTPLAGRSDASRARACAAGIPGCTMAEAAGSDLILSVVPGDQAGAVAQAVIAARKQVGGGRAGGHDAGRGRAVFVDCNPLQPAQARSMAGVLERAGLRFVDAAIVGAAPAADGTRSPRLFACARDPDALALLARTGLEIVDTQGPVGSASALKMAIAGVSKGMTGLIAMMGGLALREGVGALFVDQLARTQPALLGWARGQLPTLHPRAARWAVEMTELSGMVDDMPAQAEMFAALAEFYAATARNGPAPTHDALLDILPGSACR